MKIQGGGWGGGHCTRAVAAKACISGHEINGHQSSFVAIEEALLQGSDRCAADGLSRHALLTSPSAGHSCAWLDCKAAVAATAAAHVAEGAWLMHETLM